MRSVAQNLRQRSVGLFCNEIKKHKMGTYLRT